jgi:hypothetical protein
MVARLQTRTNNPYGKYRSSAVASSMTWKVEPPLPGPQITVRTTAPLDYRRHDPASRRR